MQIAHHFKTGEVAVSVPSCGGSYDLYTDSNCVEHIGNAASISEASRMISGLNDEDEEYPG